MYRKIKFIFLAMLTLTMVQNGLNRPEIGFCDVVVNTSNVNSASTSNPGNNSSEKKKIQNWPITKLTYKVDRKKGLLKFSKNQIYLKVGDCFTVNAGDLSLDSDCLEYLDADWQTVNNTSEYIFIGLRAGEIKLKFTSASRKLTGTVNVLITNNASGKVGLSGFKKISYKLVKNALVFSKRNVVVHKGERLLLVPDPKAVDPFESLEVRGDYATLLERKDFINGSAAWYAFKAINNGKTILECQTQGGTVDGTVKVTVIN